LKGLTRHTRKPAVILLVLLFLFSAITIMGNVQAEEGFKYPTHKTEWGYFTTEVIKETNGALTGGVDSGDADNDGEMELVVGSWSHEIYIIEYNESLGRWDSWISYTDDLDLLECHIADVDKDGLNEVLTGGYSRRLISVSIQGKESTNSTIYQFNNDIWDIKVGDLIPSIPGNEIAVAHWQDFVSVIYRDGQSWGRYNLSTHGPVTTLEIGEFDSNHSGVELLSGSEEGYMEEFYWHNGSFKTRIVYLDDRGLRNVDIGDFCSYRPGNELIGVSFSMNAGNATMVYGSGDSWTSQFLYNSSKGLEALAVGDFNPEHPGVEALFAGYSNTATMIVDDGANMDSADIWSGNFSIQSELTGITIADVYPLHPGGEAYVIGYNGVVRMITYDHPGSLLDLGLYSNSLSITKRATVTLKSKISSQGGFSGDLDVTTQLLTRNSSTGDLKLDADSNIEIVLNKTSITVIEGKNTPLDISIVTTNSSKEGEYLLKVTLSSPSDPSVTNTYTLPLMVIGSDFTLDVIPRATDISSKEGFNIANYQVSLITTSGIVNQSVSLSLSGLPSGAEYQFSKTQISLTLESILTITVDSTIALGMHNLTIVGTDGNLASSVQVTMNIVEMIGYIAIFDLSAEKISGQAYRASVTIKNQGSLPLEDFKVQFYLNDEPVYGPLVSRLEPGEEMTITDDDMELVKGKNTISVYAEDLPDHVNKAGNGLTITVGEEDADDGIPIKTVVIIITVILVVLAVAVVVGIFFLRSKQKEEELEAEDQKPSRRSTRQGTGRGEREGRVSERRSR